MTYYAENALASSDFQRAHRAVGFAEGFGESMAVCMAECALDMLEHRRIEVPEEMRVRAKACTDPEEAARWLKRCGAVTRAEELLD